ncbi:MAG: HEAT repeat domain-containing protein [Gemmatimonadota bacterium]|nr:HEAT repeat domain-containing protein [Gemmatimonadota bacterium]
MTSPCPSRLTALFCGVLLGTAACTPPDTGRPDRTAARYLQIVALEDARPIGEDELAALIGATRTSDDFLRLAAIRALGRLESPEHIEEIAEHLQDAVPDVRRQAVDALAQAVHRSDGDVALDLLLDHVGSETDAAVRGIYARSMGRLRLQGSDRARALRAILDLSTVGGEDAHPETLVGVVLGLEAMARGQRGSSLGERAEGRLSNLAFFDRVRERFGVQSARVRRLALSALGQSGAITIELVESGLRDPDGGVRTVAASYLDIAVPAARPEFIRRGLLDPSMGVRIFTVQQLSREVRDEAVCTRLIAAATRDDTEAVRVLALDALAEPCDDPRAQTLTLRTIASSLGAQTLINWQAPAHALVSLAGLAPEIAAPLLPVYVTHPNPFVRGYGARAASILGRTELVLGLLADPVPNVRTTAVQLLAQAGVDGTDELLVSQLSADDPQLLMTVAQMLEGSDLGFAAASAALAAFERISKAERETWRDSRRALLTLVAELGSASLAERLTPFLSDYDPVIAEQAADALEVWTGQPHTADPRPLPRSALPRVDELVDLTDTVVLLHMRRGGTIVIQPLPYRALTNAHRFVRLAREGYFDGLTFHRWAPNFVLQGGSPGANEYSGDGAYSRDEVGLLPHWRGTVGLSTRGHDTGDGQIFINLVDNVRLDHDYTVYGTVVAGMDVVDSLLEGDVIVDAEVVLQR